VGKEIHNLKAGDVIYLTAEIPGEWRNPGPAVARLPWIKVNFWEDVEVKSLRLKILSNR
jgi:hypothetical protein